MAKKELGFVDLFSKTLDIYTANFFVFAGISLILYFIPAFILTYLNLTSPELELGISLLSVVFVIFALLFYLSVIFAAGKFAKTRKEQSSFVSQKPKVSVKKKINAKEAIRNGVDFFSTGLLVGLMLLVFLLGLFLLLIIPGIIFMIYWIFSMYAVVLENKKGKDALDYSKRLVKGRWWKTLGYWLLINLIIYIVPLIISVKVLDPLTNAFFSQLTSAIFAPISMIFLTLYFFNLKSFLKIK